MTAPRQADTGQQGLHARDRAPRQWGVRKRSVAAATVAVTVAVTVGGALLVWVLASSLTSSAESSLAVHTTDVSELVSGLDADEVQAALAADRRAGEIVQVLTPAGVVLATSDRRLRQPISALRPAPGKAASERVSRLATLNDTDERLVAARGITVEDESRVVLVSVPIQVQSDSVRTVAWLLLAASPFMIGMVALAVWILVGRSLTTVDRIRRQVAVIDSRRLHDRVGVPGTADEIAALAITMNQMLDQLEAADLVQRSFFSNASHELRSPLSTLTTTAEVASQDPSGQTWVDLQGIMLTEISRMGSLVEDLLTLAKVDSQNLGLNYDDVDVEDLLDAEVRRIRAVTTVSVDATLHPARIAGDARRLTQVFRNLFDNAVRHARSTVVVRINKVGNSVVVTVENDGEAIPNVERERIFDRFVRLDASRAQDHGGSGLGLAIVREIITAHQGTVKVTDAARGWCRFTVELPLHDLDPAASTTVG